MAHADAAPSSDGAANGFTASDEALLLERCEFLRLSAEDSELLASLKPALSACAADFIEFFYRHLQRFPTTAAFLTDHRLVERLKGIQLRYFDSLLEGRLGPDRVSDRRRMGERHAEVGLEPPWFLGTFSLYLEHGFRVVAEQPPAAQAERLPALHVLVKHILLDIGLSLDAYYERSTNNLRQALALYTQSNTELREFARLASHDLKTPLATIAGLCEEFLDEFGPGTPEAGRELIRQARARTLQMRGMIDELLAVSEAAAEPGQRRRVSLRGLFDEALERIRLDCVDQAAEFSIPAQLPEVVAQPARLREALYQLLSNAVKHMDKRPGHVWVAADATAERVHLMVGDDGPGIAPADQDRIFAPFRRLQRSRGTPGHGLGLYVVRQIVEELGGRVWCESEPPNGCVFHVMLPNPPSARDSSPS